MGRIDTDSLTIIWPPAGVSMARLETDANGKEPGTGNKGTGNREKTGPGEDRTKDQEKKKPKKKQTVLGAKFIATFSGRRHGDRITTQSRNGMTFATTSETPTVPRIRDRGSWASMESPCRRLLNGTMRPGRFVSSSVSSPPVPSSWFLGPVVYRVRDDRKRTRSSHTLLLPRIHPRRSSRHGRSIRNSQFAIVSSRA